MRLRVTHVKFLKTLLISKDTFLSFEIICVALGDLTARIFQYYNLDKT